MNQFHFRKIKQLKEWEKDLGEVLSFKDDMDEEIRKDMIRHRSLLAYAIEQAELVQGLDELLTQVEYDMESALKNRIELIKLKRQNKRYLEALEFYANEENYLFDEKEYKVGLGVPESEITLDYGNKAREALEDEEWVKNGWKKLS